MTPATRQRRMAHKQPKMRGRAVNFCQRWRRQFKHERAKAYRNGALLLGKMPVIPLRIPKRLWRYRRELRALLLG
jgi:hypothetical protein